MSELCDTCKHNDECDKDINLTYCLINAISEHPPTHFNGIPIVPSKADQETRGE